MSPNNKPVWITGKCTKRTRRAFTVHALGRGDSVRVATIPTQYILAEEKLEGAEDYRYKVPLFVAFQNKLKYVAAEQFDIHAQTARAMFGVPADESITEEMRRAGKVRNYTEMYSYNKEDHINPAPLKINHVDTGSQGMEEAMAYAFKQMMFNGLGGIKINLNEKQACVTAVDMTSIYGAAETPSNSAQHKEEIMDIKVTPQNYASLAMRTAKLMEEKAMLVHGALGLLTEVGELTEAIFGLKPAGYSEKELGDICWFAAYTASAFLNPGLVFDASKFDLPLWVGAEAIVEMDFPRLCNAMTIVASEIGSEIKGHAFYGKPLHVVNLHTRLQFMVGLVVVASRELGLVWQEVLQTNIDKLRQRYPNNFTESDAIERKDEAGEATASYTNQDQGGQSGNV